MFFEARFGASTQVQRDVNREIAKFMAWSLGWSSAGIGPATGYNGETFPPESARGKVAGKTLAMGWRILGSCHNQNV